MTPSKTAARATAYAVYRAALSAASNDAAAARAALTAANAAAAAVYHAALTAASNDAAAGVAAYDAYVVELERIESQEEQS